MQAGAGAGRPNDELNCINAGKTAQMEREYIVYRNGKAMVKAGDFDVPEPGDRGGRGPGRGYANMGISRDIAPRRPYTWMIRQQF